MAYAGRLVLATDKADIAREVEAVKAASEDALSKVKRHEEVVRKCGDVLEDLNPAIAEKREIRRSG